MLQGSAVILFN